MLDLAIKYEESLRSCLANIAYVEKYKFMSNSSHIAKYEAETSSWGKHEFVSLDSEKNILGYFKYSIDRESSICYGLQIVNFSENKMLFGRDFLKLIDDIFIKFNFRKLKYGVIIGNPIESTYDRVTKRFGGRIVGIYLQEDLLFDNRFYDHKGYELLRENYLKNRCRKVDDLDVT